MTGPRDPIGVVLAGGAGSRLGGGKAVTALAGRPLIAYPLAALRAALADVVVVAKADTELPELDVPVWVEPDEPRHPLAGVAYALACAAPARAIVACAADLPLITPALVARIACGDAGAAPALVARAGGRLQPLLARYEPAALAPLTSALARRPLPSLTAAVAELQPAVLDLDGADADALLNVNTPSDLAAAAARLGT